MAAETTQDPNAQVEEASPGFVHNMLAGIGAPILELYGTLRDMVRILGLTIYYIINGKGGPRRRNDIISQMYEIGNRSIVFIAVTLGFLGMILIFQAGFQANRITGDLSLLGALFLQLLLREFAPTITAMMLATRVGTGMAAQLGSMVVTEQVDALRMSGAQPVDYLVVPRFIAALIMMVVLTVFAIIVSFIAGAITANAFYGVNPRTFVDFGMLTWFDLWIGMAKAIAYGIAVPITACQAGLSVVGGSEGVGLATTKAVVNASLAVIVLDFIISGIGYAILAIL
ncbi:MlaE family ABC transporter permease [Bradymonas sediminis]|uniref:ABC transporter permease n=1 Tax=Bradymonas sediminis TaxID=1548548 RepID=A0A2Z4FJP4_9DELT|nr:ABC transporter permease [Bradymonas sediminis]AWV89159.1 ABC transporter permease [Bradymonas sediminis]TDP64374.1 phospholipid/cholesterol/gamma-HCH transport system permease protein [Bradymonas sediminis]